MAAARRLSEAVPAHLCSSPVVATSPSQRVWPPAAIQPGAFAFALLFAVESVGRASILSVVPIQAYDLLKSEQKLSVFYFVVGSLGMCATLCAPILFQRLPRRFVYTLGALFLIAAMGLFATHTLMGQAGGMFLRILGGSTLAITLNLYIMEYIPKHGLVRSESLRLTLATVAWTFGPSIGVWLYVRYGVLAPFIWAAAWPLIQIALFWYLRLSGSTAIRPGKSRPVNPIASVRRFIAQPRLRLAWLIAFGRSCYWSTFFIYSPLLMITGRLGGEAGGLLISIGNAALITAVAFGRLAQKLGVRQVISWSMGVLGLASILAGLAGPRLPLLAGAFLLIGAVAGSALDGVGGIPFLRAVRARERAEMAGVYRTFIDMSELLPTLVFSVVLLFLPLGAVFVVLGLWLLIVTALSWRYLPRSM